MEKGREYHVSGLPPDDLLRLSVGLVSVAFLVEVTGTRGNDVVAKPWLTFQNMGKGIVPGEEGVSLSGWISQGPPDFCC